VPSLVDPAPPDAATALARPLALLVPLLAQDIDALPLPPKATLATLDRTLVVLWMILILLQRHKLHE
jgi:hypothetical protein